MGKKSSVNVGVRLLTTSKDQAAHPKRIMQPAKSKTVLSFNKCYQQREGEREECTIKYVQIRRVYAKQER